MSTKLFRLRRKFYKSVSTRNYQFLQGPALAPGKYEITLACCDMTTQIAREQGEIDKDERIFHLDGYYPDGSHRTFGLFTMEPSYEETRARVVQVLQGKLKAHSASKPKGDGKLDFEIEVEE